MISNIAGSRYYTLKNIDNINNIEKLGGVYTFLSQYIMELNGIFLKSFLKS